MKALSARFLAALGLLAAAPASATDIIWDIDLRGANNHLRSTGQKFGDGFVFELGVFASGFTPSAANTAQWAANWTAASRGAWDSQFETASGTASFTANPAPFTIGAQAWLWGICGNEWVLLRKPAWTWPAGSPIGGPATTWTADGTVTMVAGSVVNTASTFTYTSALVSAAPPPLCFADWQRLFFTAAEIAAPATSGPDADPDADGATNVHEYLTATQPRKKSSMLPLNTAPEFIQNAGSTYLGLRLRTDPRACFQFTAQRSGNLTSWTTFTPVTVTSTAGLLLVRETLAESAASRSFLRLRLSPAP